MKVFIKSGQVTLDKNNYLTAGGEGDIYVKNGKAFKIYHDPAKMIPDGKIFELSQISLNNVISPLEVIKDGQGRSIGFVMNALKKTEFLVKLFAKGFRDANGITPNTTAALVKRMQDTCGIIHKMNCLLVDANEFNFLISQDFKEIFFIDTDSYQTPSFPATALMESVRDRKVKNNQFTIGSDWFSIGVTMFQLYVGMHPYKARHPNYKLKDWMKMMDDNVSVFNPQSKLSPLALPLTVIPKGHLKWFEAVFEHGERKPPPQPEQVDFTAAIPQPRIITGNDDFDISIHRTYDAQIVVVRYIAGVCYVLTRKALYADQKKIANIFHVAGYKKDIIPVQGGEYCLSEFNIAKDELRLSTIHENIGTFQSTGYFIHGDNFYFVCNNSLIHGQIVKVMGKLKLLQTIAYELHPNHTIYDGVIIQNILGTYRATIPYEGGKCALLNLQELQGHRVFAAKYQSGKLIILSENGGKVYWNVFVTKDHVTYSFRQEPNVNIREIDFTVKDNGVCIAQGDSGLELFVDNQTVKKVASPLAGNELLFNFCNTIYFSKFDKIYKIQSK